MKSNKSGKRPGSKPVNVQAGRPLATAATAAAQQLRAPTPSASGVAIPSRWVESVGQGVVWAVLGLLAVALLQNGLFFIDVQKPGVFLALCIGCGALLLVKAPINWRDPAIWGVAAFVGGYLLCIPGAARPAQAIHGTITVIAAGSMFLLGMVAVRGRNAPRLLATGIVVLTVVLFGHSILNLAGVLNSVDSIIGGRMSSLFQYSNTFALFCTVGVLAAAALTLDEGRWWALSHLGVTIGLTGLILSQSRAMYLLLPVLMVLWGVFVGRRVLREAAIFGFDAVAAFIASLILIIPSNNPLARGYWVLGVTAILWLGSYYGSALMRTAVSRLGQYSRPVTWAGAALGVLASAAVFLRFGQSIVTRLGSLRLDDPAVLGRIYTLIDGLRVLKAHPLGLGVDGWRAGYFGFASYYYITNAAHSYWIEVAVSAGVLGILGLLWLLAVQAVRLWLRLRQGPAQNGHSFAINTAIALGTVAIALHSAIDWDLAFLGFMLFFWFLLGYVNGWCVPTVVERPTTVSQAVPLMIGLACLSIVSTQWSADVALNEGVRHVQRSEFSQGIAQFRRAATRDPWNSFGHVNLAYAYVAAAPKGDPQAVYEAEKEFAVAERYDRLNYQIYVRIGQFLRDHGKFDQAVEKMELAVRHAPWRPDAWSNLIGSYTKAAETALSRGDSAELARWVKAGKDALSRYEKQLASQPAFTLNNPDLRFPENDPDLKQTLANFSKIQAYVP